MLREGSLVRCFPPGNRERRLPGFSSRTDAPWRGKSYAGEGGRGGGGGSPALQGEEVRSRVRGAWGWEADDRV